VRHGIDLVTKLLEFGANPALLDIKGYSAGQYAERKQV
jgi:hypothetical protein